jgi:hypothetical protein
MSCLLENDEMKLNDYSLPLLQKAAEHLADMERQVGETLRENPNADLALVIAILKRDRADLTTEIEQRIADKRL